MKMKKLLLGLMMALSLSFVATTPTFAIEDASSYTYEEATAVTSSGAVVTEQEPKEEKSLGETTKEIALDFLKNNILNILAITGCLIALGIILSKNKKLKKERIR